MDETVPEIRRTNLSNTVLYLKALGIRDVLGFDFLDPPQEDQIIHVSVVTRHLYHHSSSLDPHCQALTLLHTLGALDEDGHISSLGHQMSTLPLEPSMSRALVEAGSR